MDVAKLARCLTGGSGKTLPHSLSRLSYDGQPLQLCLSATREGISARLVGDPGWSEADPASRLRLSRKCLDLLVDERAPAARPLCHSLLDRLLPTDPALLARYTAGFLWLGAGLSGRGLAVYLEMAPWAAEGWSKAADELGALLPDRHPLEEACAVLRDTGALASVGLETSGDATRAKLYWRLRRPMALAEVGLAPFADAENRDFLVELLGARQIRSSGLLLSAGFSLADGALADTKVEVCGCPACLSDTNPHWQRVLGRLGDRFALPVAPIAEVLQDSRIEIAFVGLRRGLDGRNRLNVYLKQRT